MLFIAVLFQDNRLSYAAPDTDMVFSAPITKVVDGDTIEVRRLGKIVRVRLWGIDTPEWQQGFSHEAHEFTKRRLAGCQVEVRGKEWDKYGRLVAMVTVDGNPLNEELLREGLAWVHIYYCKEPICRQWRQIKKEAKGASLGLWQESHPLAPWEWKQTHNR